MDSTPQSYVDLDDPLYLDFEYVQRLGHVLDLAAPEARRYGCCTWAAAR